jgi:hypothetical protein
VSPPHRHSSLIPALTPSVPRVDATTCATLRPVHVAGATSATLLPPPPMHLQVEVTGSWPKAAQCRREARGSVGAAVHGVGWLCRLSYSRMGVLRPLEEPW